MCEALVVGNEKPLFHISSELNPMKPQLASIYELRRIVCSILQYCHTEMEGQGHGQGARMLEEGEGDKMGEEEE